MTDEKLERAAKAAWKSYWVGGGHFSRWKDVPDAIKKTWRAVARAVVKEMEKPDGK